MASGSQITDPRFTRAKRWLVDITAVTAQGRQLAIEYDGAYWHQDKTATDEGKTKDLLAAGWLVVRLREDPLPGLSIDSPDYLEITVYADAAHPVESMGQIRRWASSTSRNADAQG